MEQKEWPYNNLLLKNFVRYPKDKYFTTNNFHTKIYNCKFSQTMADNECKNCRLPLESIMKSMNGSNFSVLPVPVTSWILRECFPADNWWISWKPLWVQLVCINEISDCVTYILDMVLHLSAPVSHYLRYTWTFHQY